MRPIMTADELRSHKVDAYGRDYSRSDDGYDDMDVNFKDGGWHAVSSWGLSGWDLGQWPYVVISVRDADFDLLSTCEGDRDVYHFDTPEDRDAAIDYLFLWYAASKDYSDFPAIDRDALNAGNVTVDERYRGPFSWSRLDASKDPQTD